MATVTAYGVAFSVFCRLSAAALKFALLVYLAKYISVHDLGLLGVIFSIIFIGVQILGGEAHLVNSRDIVSKSKENAVSIIKAQLCMHLTSYFLAIPLSLLIFNLLNLEYKLSILLTLLLVSEHLSHELARFLQFVLRPIRCAILIFVKNGMWCLIVILAATHFESNLEIELIVSMWLLFSTFSVFLGLLFIQDYLLFQGATRLFSLEWVKVTLRKAFPFFLTAVCFSISQHLDRLFLKAFSSATELGVFFFMTSMAASLHMFVMFAVSVFYAPLAVRAFRQNGLAEYQAVRRVFFRKTLVALAVGSFAGILLIDPVLAVIDKESYSDFKYIFYSLLIVNALLLLSDFANLDLYVRGMDREMMLAHMTGLVISLIVGAAFVILFGINGAVLGALFFVVCLWLSRLFFYQRATNLNTSLKSSYRH